MSSEAIDRVARVVYRTPPTTLPFGIQFLDDATRGLFPGDFCLLGGYSGIGKTELAVNCALANAKTKRVHFFALEAKEDEIESRVLFRVISVFIHGLKTLKEEFQRLYPNTRFNYLDWYCGEYDAFLDKFKPEFEQIVKEQLRGLTVEYPGNNMLTEESIGPRIEAIQETADLIIIDHLHYFDFIDANENRAMKVMTKTLKDIADKFGKPILAVAHLRKKDRRSEEIFPSMDDFHGSSDLAKIATKAVLLAPYGAMPPGSHVIPTLIGVVKDRQRGELRMHLALCGFNLRENKYDISYRSGSISKGEFKQAQFNPYWAKHALPPEDVTQPDKPTGKNWVDND